jgi:8-oxoguanine deaminase
LSTESVMNEASFLIRNASAIMTGLNEDGGRQAGPDIHIAGGVIVEIGSLAPQPGETLVDATDCVVIPELVLIAAKRK